MTINHIKLFVIAIVLLPVLTIAVFFSDAVRASVLVGSDDPAVTYKTKCAMCHTAKAEKNFDTAKTDEELVQTILKGKKGEKPPFMPGFEAKGMKQDEAKALVIFMKSLRTPAN